MGTNTAKYSLYKPTINEQGWGSSVNSSMDIIDDFPLLKKGADVVSEAALFTTAGFPTDGNYFDVTGSTTITSIVTSGTIGTIIGLHFDSALTITHHLTDLVLPGSRNILTIPDGELLFIEYASGDWRCIGGSMIPDVRIKSILAVNNQVVCNNNEVVIL